jgi:hypothetical protein
VPVHVRALEFLSTRCAHGSLRVLRRSSRLRIWALDKSKAGKNTGLYQLMFFVFFFRPFRAGDVRSRQGRFG